jgi:hypothetical protein
MNFLSRSFFQRSYYLLRKNRIKLGFKTIYFLVLAGIFLEIGLIVYNYTAFAHKKIDLQEPSEIVSGETLQKIELLKQYQNDNRELTRIVNKLAGITPENIKLSKVSIDASGNVLLDCVSNTNNFNDFVKIIKQDPVFENVSLQNFSAAAAGDKKTGLIKAKVR